MNKLIFPALIAVSCFFSCKKEDKYTISAQMVTFQYADTGKAPYALNYSVILKSNPFFTSFGKPVAFADGHYELSVLTPYEIDPGGSELYIYDSLENIIEKFNIIIPAPETSKSDIFKNVFFNGIKYVGEVKLKYSPVD